MKPSFKDVLLSIGHSLFHPMSNHASKTNSELANSFTTGMYAWINLKLAFQSEDFRSEVSNIMGSTESSNENTTAIVNFFVGKCNAEIELLTNLKAALLDKTVDFDPQRHSRQAVRARLGQMGASLPMILRKGLHELLPNNIHQSINNIFQIKLSVTGVNENHPIQKAFQTAYHSTPVKAIEEAALHLTSSKALKR